MDIIPFSDDQFEEYLSLLDREYAGDGAQTRYRDDFPLLLDPSNRNWILGICHEGRVVAGLSCLIRQMKTSCGTVPVAGIGGVLTIPEFQGRGFSRSLQEALRKRLEAANVPLAVLWTDRPDIYRNQGFSPAGWEFHADLADLRPHGRKLPGYDIQPYRPEYEPAISLIYTYHYSWTLRHPGDAQRLYGMPGTRGLVAVGENDTVAAAVFCGKGVDFQDYVVEWAGARGLVLALLEEVQHRGWARNVLIPAGGMPLAAGLVNRGAVVTARTSGCWSVIQPEQLSHYLQRAGQEAPKNSTDPRNFLGAVDDEGVVVPGPLTIGVWGFDSV